jgi:methanol dehydrogenase (cytochrome c) subunit 1
VFDLQDPTAGLGAVGAFRNLQNWTQMGGGMLVFSLGGKGPYDDPNLDEFSTTVE